MKTASPSWRILPHSCEQYRRVLWRIRYPRLYEIHIELRSTRPDLCQIRYPRSCCPEGGEACSEAPKEDGPWSLGRERNGTDFPIPYPAHPHAPIAWYPCHISNQNEDPSRRCTQF